MENVDILKQYVPEFVENFIDNDLLSIEDLHVGINNIVVNLYDEVSEEYKVGFIGKNLEDEYLNFNDQHRIFEDWEDADNEYNEMILLDKLGNEAYKEMKENVEKLREFIPEFVEEFIDIPYYQVVKLIDLENKFVVVVNASDRAIEDFGIKNYSVSIVLKGSDEYDNVGDNHYFDELEDALNYANDIS